LARGAARLIPTTQPYMVKALWPELIDGDVPQTDQIWETTRFVCDRNLNSETRRRIVAELICGCQEFGIAPGISSYLGVMPVGIFRHVIAAAGCPVTLLCPPKRMGTHDIAAAYIDVSPKTLAVVQQCSAERRSAAKWAKHRNPAQRATSKVGIVLMRATTSNGQLEERQCRQPLRRPRSRKYHRPEVERARITEL
jgi:N-acyl-L-homoserine lactone synthetase